MDIGLICFWLSNIFWRRSVSPSLKCEKWSKNISSTNGCLSHESVWEHASRQRINTLVIVTGYASLLGCFDESPSPVPFWIRLWYTVDQLACVLTTLLTQCRSKDRYCLNSLQSRTLYPKSFYRSLSLATDTVKLFMCFMTIVSMDHLTFSIHFESSPCHKHFLEIVDIRMINKLVGEVSWSSKAWQPMSSHVPEFHDLLDITDLRVFMLIMSESKQKSTCRWLWLIAETRRDQGSWVFISGSAEPFLSGGALQTASNTTTWIK